MMLTPSPAIFLNSAVDSDPVARPSDKIQLSPVLNLIHFLSIVDIMGKGVSGVCMDDNSIPNTRCKRRQTIFPIIRLIPQGIHSGLKLGTGKPCLIHPFPFPDARMNIVYVVSLAHSKFTILSKKHDPWHRRIISRIPREIQTYRIPLPMIFRISPITLAKLENYPL